jgi:putative tricarboxylic transport membrane protein
MDAKKRDGITASFWIILGLIIAVCSSTFPFGEWKAPGPGILPFSLGLILVFLGTILFFRVLKRSDHGEPASYASLIPKGEPLKRVVLTIVGMFLTVVLLNSLGFLLTVFLLLLFLTRIIEPPQWSFAVIYALASAVGSYVLFQVLFKTPLPRGFLGF